MLLIVGDPKGTHSLTALQKYKPEDIWVWENDPRHFYTIRQINDKINLVENLQELVSKKMHFDVTIGNPPYTNTSSVDSARNAGSGGCASGLDDKFFELSQKISSRVSMIMRTKFFAKKSSTFRSKLFKNGGVVSIVGLREETFPSISGTPTCVVTWSADHKGSTRVVYLDGTEKYVDLTEDTCIKLDNPNYVAEVENNLAHRYMRGRIKQRELVDGSGTQPVLTSMGGFNGSMEDNLIHVDEKVKVDCVNQHGVVMNAIYQSSGARTHKKNYVSASQSASSDKKVIATGPIYVKPYEYGISSSTVILKTSSYEESQKLQEYLMSDEMQEYMFYNRINNANTRELFATVEDIL